MATSATIGDKPVKAVKAVATAIPVPVVKASDLTSSSSAINNALLSGKKLGAMVCDETGLLYIATGDAKTAKWKKLTATDVTPT